MNYFSLIISFIILLCLVVTGVQNNTPLEIKLGWWAWQTSLPGVIFWAAVGGAAMTAVLSLPKLIKKALETRRLNKEVRRLEGLCRQPGQKEAG